MAFTTTETRLDLVAGGTSGKCYLFGTYTNTGGSTGGEIKPGNNTTNVSGSAGLKKIIAEWYSSSSATPSEVRSVKAFDATQGGDKLTITTAADQTGEFIIYGEYAGT